MANETQVTTGGISFTGALAICFICLKLCNVIQWSWLWVLSPIWIPMAIIMICVIIIGILQIIIE